MLVSASNLVVHGKRAGDHAKGLSKTEKMRYTDS